VLFPLYTFHLRRISKKAGERLTVSTGRRNPAETSRRRWRLGQLKGAFSARITVAPRASVMGKPSKNVFVAVSVVPCGAQYRAPTTGTAVVNSGRVARVH
jgi:hypothetical protein